MTLKLGLIPLTASLLMMSQTTIAKEYVSQITSTNVIELYTSEGCSSCPPADRWLSSLKSDPNIFKHFIPMAFHVDYWNKLGWTDRFSNKANSQRQYIHQQQGNISQVYTPGFVMNNKEWRGWFSNNKSWNSATNPVGILSVNHNEQSQQLRITFAPEQVSSDKNLQLNIAILGMALSNEIEHGENRGKQLNHDFVVLKHHEQSVTMAENTASQTWQTKMPEIPVNGQKQSALVVWLSPTHSPTIIQAAGGYL